MLRQTPAENSLLSIYFMLSLTSLQHIVLPKHYQNSAV